MINPKQILVGSCLPLMRRISVKVANKCERSRIGAISSRELRSVAIMRSKGLVRDVEI